MSELDPIYEISCDASDGFQLSTVTTRERLEAFDAYQGPEGRWWVCRDGAPVLWHRELVPEAFLPSPAAQQEVRMDQEGYAWWSIPVALVWAYLAGRITRRWG